MATKYGSENCLNEQNELTFRDTSQISFQTDAESFRFP